MKWSQKQVLSNIRSWYGESMVWINEIVLLYYQIGNFVQKNEKEIYPQNYTAISLRIWDVWKIPSKCLIFAFFTTYDHSCEVTETTFLWKDHLSYHLKLICRYNFPSLIFYWTVSSSSMEFILKVVSFCIAFLKMKDNHIFLFLPKVRRLLLQC